MKKNSVVGIIVACFFVLLLIVLITAIFIPSINENEAEKKFSKSGKYMRIVGNYLENIEDSSARITRFRSDIKIEDNEVKRAIWVLKWHGYSVIEKTKDTVCFEKWLTFDGSRGILYQPDNDLNKIYNEVQFLIEIAPLSEKCWYYYAEDFNEWERQQRTQ